MNNEIKKYIKDLSSNDVEARRQAVERLGEFHDDQCIEPLLLALGDDDWRVRKTAVSAILNLEHNEKVLNGLIASLRSEDNVGLRNASVEVLTKIGEVAVHYLTEAFRDNDRDVRKFIADILGDIGDRRAAKALIKGLSDVDENVSLAAVEALGKLKDKTALEPLVNILKRNDKLLSYTVIKALEGIGDASIVDVLIPLINKSGIEKAVIDALGSTGDIRSLEPLLATFKDVRLRKSAFCAVTSLYEKNSEKKLKDKVVSKTKAILTKEITTYLIDALSDPNPKIRISAIMLLGWSGDIHAVRPLFKFLDSEDSGRVIRAVIDIGKDAEDIVIEKITEGNEIVREGAAHILGEIGDKKSVNALILFLGDENGHVRQTSATALGKIGDAAAAKSLIDLLSDEYPNVQEAAIEALGRINDRTLIPHFLKMLANEDENIRGNVAKILGRLKAKETISNLLFMLKDESPYVRQRTVDALGSINDPATEGGLMIALTDEDKMVRLAAVSALIEKKNKKFLQPLTSLLKDNDIWIRVSVIKGIGEIGGRDAVQAITEMLDDKVGAVRIAAIEELERLGDKKIGGRIISMLNDKDTDVRRAAIKALGCLKVKGGKEALKDLMQTENDHTVKEYVKEVLDKF